MLSVHVWKDFARSKCALCEDLFNHKFGPNSTTCHQSPLCQVDPCYPHAIVMWCRSIIWFRWHLCTHNKTLPSFTCTIWDFSEVGHRLLIKDPRNLNGGVQLLGCIVYFPSHHPLVLSNLLTLHFVPLSPCLALHFMQPSLPSTFSSPLWLSSILALAPLYLSFLSLIKLL